MQMFYFGYALYSNISNSKHFETNITQKKCNYQMNKYGSKWKRNYESVWKNQGNDSKEVLFLNFYDPT